MVDCKATTGRPVACKADAFKALTYANQVKGDLEKAKIDCKAKDFSSDYDSWVKLQC